MNNMTNETKSADALPQQSALPNSPTPSIPQNTANTQGKEYKGSKKARKVLPVHAKVYAFAVKCYEEQLPYGLAWTINAIKNIDKSQYHVMMILHDRDLVTDGIWEYAYVKPHLHIIIRCADRKCRVRVSTMMNMLGVFFRPGIDDDLWKDHGVETIGEYTGYAMYLTHETRDAIADGKELYDISEIVSNLTLEEVEQVRSGYTRIVDSSKRLTTPELEALDRDAFQMGYEMKNFNEWYDAQPFIVRSNAKMKTIRESYERGIANRIEEGTQMCRLCIFIHGAGNTGKTYAAEEALKGKRVLMVGGGGTGKFDELRPDHEAIIIDDDACPNLLNMSDNKICRAYRRGKNNPVWAGKYLIVTSNLSFKEWVESCGIHTEKGYYGRHTRQYEAILSRFCIGRVLESDAGYNQFYVERMSNRGGTSIMAERGDMIRDFLAKYNSTISQYNPQQIQANYGDILTNLSHYFPIT